MNYKYIQQLLERYWNAQTTLEEEEILRAFFLQDDIPANMLHYKALFEYEATSNRNERLSEDFDNKMMRIIDSQDKGQRAINVSFLHRLRPLFRAVACVCVIVTIGAVINHSLEYGQQQHEESVAQNVDTITMESPSVADMSLDVDTCSITSKIDN